MDYNPEVHSLECPKCHHGMNEVTHDGITVDRCSNCQGIWFDTGEEQLLKLSPKGESVDTGSPSEGWKWDSHADINCPRCGNEMEKSADPKQKHIWYEACVDHGIFMDAGEFSDFKSESFLDCFRSLVKGRRDTVAP